VSELCERNSAIAEEYGKDDVATTWKLIKTMYGEEFVQNSMNTTGGKHEDTCSSEILEDQKSKGFALISTIERITFDNFRWGHPRSSIQWWR